MSIGYHFQCEACGRTSTSGAFPNGTPCPRTCRLCALNGRHPKHADAGTWIAIAVFLFAGFVGAYVMSKVAGQCPDYESVRRSRCEIQAGGEFLPTDPKVIAARRKKQGDVREALGYERDSERETRAERADVYVPKALRPRGAEGVLFDAGRPDAH